MRVLICGGLFLLTGCFTSSREEALRGEIRALDARLVQFEKNASAKEKTFESVKSVAEESRQKNQSTRSEIDDLKRQLLLTQGGIDELRVKFARLQESGGAGGGQGAPAQENIVAASAETTAALQQLEKRLARLELLVQKETKEKDHGGVHKPVAHHNSKFKTGAELYKAAGPLLAAKDYKKVVALCSDVLDDESPGADLKEAALFLRGEAFFALKNHEQAALDFADLLQSFPKSDKRPRALLLVGDCYVYLKQPATAKAYYQECTQTHPEREECKAAKERLAKMGV